MSSHVENNTPPVPEADLEWCHEAVQGVSRTFALTVDVLEEPMSSYIGIGYLLCRVADTVEDANHIPPADQALLLERYDEALDPEDSTTIRAFDDEVSEFLPEERSADWDVVANAPRVVRAFEHLPPDVQEAVRPPVRELVQGMVSFVERYADEGGLRLQTRDELEEYCYYAAGTVGNLITNLVTRGGVDGERKRRLYDTAEEFGLLLQLVNISKDVHDDYVHENNVYLPAEWLEAEGVPQEDVLAPRHEPRVANVVRRTASHARTFLDDAQTYLETVPTTDGNTLAAWAIPFLLSVGTLRELFARPEDAVTGKGVKVTRQEVFAVVSAMSETTDRETLGELRNAIWQEPLHLVSTPAE
jgi:farnesyl-diphosphate farnesyltransferase